MHDRKILSACVASRDAYEKISKHITDKDLTAHVRLWWQLVGEWYSADKKAYAIDLELLKDKGKRQLPEKHLDSLLEVIVDLPEAPSPGNVANEVLELKRYNLEMNIAGMIAGREDRKKIQDKVEQLQEIYRATTLAQSDVVVAGGLDELDSLYSRDNLIKLAPKILTDRTDGGACKGDHILIYARPELGKSLFAINMAAGFLKQGLKILYIGNEDKIQKIQYRLRSNLSNMSRHVIERGGQAAIDEANRRARRQGIEDRAVMVHLHPGSTGEIDELCDEHRPDALILDQIRNIGGGAELTQRLNQVALETRAMLGRYDMLGVSITQANAPEGVNPKVWLDMGDIDSSKTGLPAQADLLLGIGADEGMLQSGERAVSICKNKLNGNHEPFFVQMDYQTSKVR
jgi:hypothetical protein